MTRNLLLWATAAALMLAAACATSPPVVTAPPPRDLIVLTTHPEDGPLGSATVTTPTGAVSLTRVNEGVQVRLGSAPPAPAVVPAADLQRIFGDAVAVMPPAARRYLLYFELGSDTLTPAARVLVSEILALVQARPWPDVGVVGHTDTTGAAPANVELGLRRSTLVRDLLVGAGLDGALVEVASHGESNPVVATPDNTADARNRRVEVTVR